MFSTFCVSACSHVCALCGVHLCMHGGQKRMLVSAHPQSYSFDAGLSLHFKLSGQPASPSNPLVSIPTALEPRQVLGSTVRYPHLCSTSSCWPSHLTSPLPESESHGFTVADCPLSPRSFSRLRCPHWGYRCSWPHLLLLLCGCWTSELMCSCLHGLLSSGFIRNCLF